LSIEENLTFVARLYDLDPVSRRGARYAGGSGPVHAAQAAWPARFSGGWKQRLALAACIMHKPKLLLLDEPTAGVDPKARREFWDEIHMRANAGLTVLVSTHYMDEAERCHRIHYISYGKLARQRHRAEVIRDAALTTFVVEGGRITQAAKMLQGMAGVDQVAPFGLTLHVVGQDRQALLAAITSVAGQTGVSYGEGRPAWRMCSSSSWADRRTTWHEQVVLVAPADGDHHQGSHPDAARPHHLRDDAGRAADAAGAVRLRHQQRSKGAAGGAGDNQPGPLHPRHGLGDGEHRLLPVRSCRRQRRGGRPADQVGRCHSSSRSRRISPGGCSAAIIRRS
jgi:hypothetical protein